ncbi:AEC family transporter [Acinetobacter terrestris]|uniref:AEC family transporter n=1 Tax=Acinetobacter terrestris TaxID=2529843 RepID=UPI0010395985|nr:AEC family transporter [Acinetobacter terrestris]NNH36780.1 AEC family transporter [Acinetobacter terrestris]TCB64896.1 AEC family transporter [Acinetobacter terrestris]
MNVVMALFPLIMLIAMGYIFKRTQFLTDEFWRGAEKLNYLILFPVLLFNNLAYIKLELATITQVLLALFIIIIITALTLWVAKAFFHIPIARFGVYVQSQIRFNTYIGLSIMSLLFGAQGMQMFAMMIALAIPLVNVISVLAFSQGQGLKPAQILFSLIKNPLILGCLVGIIFNLLQLSLFSGLEQLFKILASMSLPLGLICVGAALQFADLKHDYSRLLLNTLGRLIVVPGLAYLICYALNLNQFETIVLVVFFALPTASASYILTRYFNGDSQLMAGIISLQTLCFAVTFPVLMLLLS